MFFKFPYVDMYTLNLDWMIKYLEETKANLEQWQTIIDSLGTIVHSVNGQTGDVNLGTLVNSVNGQTGNVNLGTLVNSVNNKTGNVEIDNDDINALKIELVLQTTDPASTFTPAVVTPLFNSGIRFIIINNKEFYSITEAGAMIRFNPFEDMNISKELAQPPASQTEIEALYNQGIRFISYTVSDVVRHYALEKIDSVVVMYDLDAANGANLFNFIDSNETIEDYSLTTLQTMYSNGIRFLFQDEPEGTKKFYALLGTEVDGYTGYTEYDPVSYFDNQWVPSLQTSVRELENTLKPTYNLFNIDTVVTGALLTSGAIGGTQPELFWTSDFIEVNKESFVISWDTTPQDGLVRIGYYNDDKTFIKRQLVTITGMNSLIGNPIYQYIRISFEKDVTSVMVEKGVEPSTYAPYKGAVDYIARKDLKNLIPENKIIAFLGDSITAGTGTDIVYHMYIAQRFGWTCKNYGYGGCGYALSYSGVSGLMATGQSGKGVAITKNTKIIPNNFESRISTIDTNIDALVIFGGTNDWGNGGDTITVLDFETSVRNTITYAQTNFGRIPIIVLLPIHRQNDTVVNGQGKTLKEYAEIIKNICIEMGVYYVDLMSKSGLYPDNQTNATLFFTRDDSQGTIDGIHPNHYAHKNIANACTCALTNMLH